MTARVSHPARCPARVAGRLQCRRRRGHDGLHSVVYIHPDGRACRLSWLWYTDASLTRETDPPRDPCEADDE